MTEQLFSSYPCKTLLVKYLNLMSALENMVWGEPVNLTFFWNLSSNMPCNMFHKLQIGNMTWLQLEKTFQ